MNEKRKKLVSGIFLMVLACLYGFGIGFIEKKVQVSAYGNSRIIPVIAAVGLFICGIWITISAAKETKRPKMISEPIKERRSKVQGYIPVILTFVLLLLYAVGLSFTGFLIATPPYLFAQAILLLPSQKRSRKMFFGVLFFSVVSTAVIYFIFTGIFEMILPRR